MKVKAFAPAKINLTLHVTGQRADGYHLLDSLVMFADVGDRITVQKADVSALTVTGPMAEGVPTDGRNLVLQAAELLGVKARITLDKHLPAAAGIGGGSADAAATLQALATLYNRPLPDLSAIASLGADVPVCLTAQATRMSGIGDQLSALPPSLPKLHAVLVNPGISMPTPAVFKTLKIKDNPPMPAALPEFSSPRAFAGWLGQQRNDLEAAARSGQPVIADVLKALSGLPAALLVRMSGSGATCFALFDNAESAAKRARALQQAHRGWWVRDVALF